MSSAISRRSKQNTVVSSGLWRSRPVCVTCTPGTPSNLVLEQCYCADKIEPGAGVVQPVATSLHDPCTPRARSVSDCFHLKKQAR